MELADRCEACGGLHVRTLAGALEMGRRDHLPVLCMCEACCASTIQIAARLLDEIAIEQAEIVRSRIAGMAARLRESGVVLRSVDIPQSERVGLLTSPESN